MFNFLSSCMQEENADIEKLKKKVEIYTLPYYNEKIDPYICVFEQALTPDFCDEIIKVYHEHKDLQHPGVTIGGESLLTKKTIDLSITGSNIAELDEIDAILNKNIDNFFRKYRCDIYKSQNQADYVKFATTHDTGYQLQRYIKNEGFYTIHTDDQSIIMLDTINSRLATFIWYLNDVDEGGETVFVKKCKIKPTKGSLLIFPATWTYHHCGMVPESNDKYIITGWLYSDVNNLSFQNNQR